MKEVKTRQDIFDLPDSQYDVATLTDYYAKATTGSQRILPKEKRRYVMYLRKSTDDEAKQVRSLEDQETECRALAEQLGVKIRDEDVLIESASAKKSGNRPLFDAMLLGFKTGRYHGLLSWSPDRLSRNMKEAGEIIEMIDLEQIQDLCFKTYQFENNPNGKMLLGILFATSKQYSDKLSVDVSRGITGAIREGKYVGVIKKGYYVDLGTGYFVPDTQNWQLLRKAVLMRLKDGKTNQEVANFLNSSGFSYRKHQEDEYKKSKLNKKTVAKLLSDPFYCGVYEYGKNYANLHEIYNFVPLVTTDEHIVLSKNTADTFNKEYAGRTTNAQRLEFGVLREKVICDFCDSIMGFQRTKLTKGKNTGSYTISFYCKNKDCLRHKPEEAIKQFGKPIPKSIRLKFLTAHIAWTLRNLTKNTEQAYKQYIGRLEQQLEVDRAIARRKVSDAKTDLNKEQNNYAKYQILQRDDPEAYKKHHKNKLEDQQELVNAREASLTQAEKELDRVNRALPTKEQFVELIRSYLKTLTSTSDLVEEDLVYREVVLNLRAGNDVVSVIKLNPPYNMMVDLEKVPSGRGERTRTSGLRVPNAAR